MIGRTLILLTVCSLVGPAAVCQENEAEKDSRVKQEQNEGKRKPRPRRRSIELTDYNASLRSAEPEPEIKQTKVQDKNKPAIKNDVALESNSDKSKTATKKPKSKKSKKVDKSKKSSKKDKSSILAAPGKVTKGTSKAIGGGFKKVGRGFGSLHGLLFGSDK